MKKPKELKDKIVQLQVQLESKNIQIDQLKDRIEDLENEIKNSKV